MEDRIIAELNSVFGSKVENLSKSHALVDKYVSEMNAIEEKVRKLHFICLSRLNLFLF